MSRALGLSAIGFAVLSGIAFRVVQPMPPPEAAAREIVAYHVAHRGAFVVNGLLNGVALCLLGVFASALATRVAAPLAQRLLLLFGAVATMMLLLLEVVALVLALRVEDEAGAKLLWEIANTGFPFTGFPLSALLITFAVVGRPSWLAKAALLPAAILLLGAVAFAAPALSFAKAAAFPLLSLWLVVSGVVWLRERSADS